MFQEGIAQCASSLSCFLKASGKLLSFLVNRFARCFDLVPLIKQLFVRFLSSSLFFCHVCISRAGIVSPWLPAAANDRAGAGKRTGEPSPFRLNDGSPLGFWEAAVLPATLGVGPALRL